MRGLDMVANAAVLTLLTAVCSIPLVTIGAALSASYEAAWAAKEGRGYLLRTYFSAFKRNFPVATAIWSVLAATGLWLIALWLFTTSMAAMIVKIMLTLLWLIIMVWAWPLTARFENSVMATLRNAATVRWHIARLRLWLLLSFSHRNRTNSGQSAMASQRIVSIADTGLRHSGTTANTTVRTCTKTLCK